MWTNKGIDLDSAANGVCLPASEDAKNLGESGALVHAGKSNQLHGPKVLENLLENCQNMNASEFKDFLREVGAGYTRGIPLGP